MTFASQFLRPGGMFRQGRDSHGEVHGGARDFIALLADLAPSTIPRAEVTVVIPVLNELDCTRDCVASLINGGTEPASLLVIDNGSSDGTPHWLDMQPEIAHLRNRVNLGCGGAWTQGALQSDSEWVVLLNNDVIVCPQGIADLLAAADQHGFDVVSPSMVEGPLDYDFGEHAFTFRKAMRGRVRRGWFHGVCFAVRRHVFETIGFPDTDRQLGGREDVEFLVRCQRHGIPVGTVGDVVLHHFGSVTQRALKRQLGVCELGDRHYFYRKLGMGWLARKEFKRTRREQARAWAASERACGYSMHMLRRDGAWAHADYL
jgi:GT2 family glycosyltransferase